jgi:thioredoxin-dependent peroxiredoxin
LPLWTAACGPESVTPGRHEVTAERNEMCPAGRGRGTSMQERTGVVTFMGRPLTLLGPDLGEGAGLPDFTLVTNDLTPVGRADIVGKVLLLNVVPSLDTGVCSAQTRRFNEELAHLPATVEVVTVSADLPFAQARFAATEHISHRLLSDHRDFSFGPALGLGIKELRLLTRAILVVDPGGKITYREIVPEISHHPDYEAALDALR